MVETSTSTSKKYIVILGGSYAGVSIAHNILKHVIPKLPDKESYQVVLVSKSSKVICRPATPRALISNDMFAQEKLFVSIPKAFEQYPKASFVFSNGTATEFDHANRTVSISPAAGGTEQINFYALVIATGGSTPSPLLSLNRDDEFLRTSWTTFRTALASAKSIVVVGGGPTGIETAGELGEYLNGKPGWFGSKLANPRVTITVVTSDSNILPVLRPSLAKKAEDFLAAVGVKVVKNARVTSVSPEGAGTNDVASKATLTLGNGMTLEADLYIPATGTRANTAFVDKALLTVDGRVDTNPSTLRVDKAGPRIYAVGDVASAARPAIHNIFSTIPVLCANIKRDLMLAAGTEERSIGKSKGVGAVMGYQIPSFLVWLIKGRDYWLWTTGDLWSGKQWAKEP